MITPGLDRARGFGRSVHLDPPGARGDRSPGDEGRDETVMGARPQWQRLTIALWFSLRLGQNLVYALDKLLRAFDCFLAAPDLLNEIRALTAYRFQVFLLR